MTENGSLQGFSRRDSADPGRFVDMPFASVAVTAASDEGDTVIVWGTPDGASGEGEPVGFVFHSSGERGDRQTAMRASRLVRGVEVRIEYSPVSVGWNIARRLVTP